MRIAFLGHGNVGAPLADHLQRLGHEVTLAAADPGSDGVKKALGRNPDLKVAPPREAVGGAGVVFLATPFQANEEVLKGVAPELGGKVLVDCTNPVGPGLRHGLESRESGSQAVQKLVPAARVVKAFSIYGFENFEDSRYPAYGVEPAMMFCGDDAAAKRVVGELVAQLGWEPLDVGGLEQALHLEHMTLLWVRMVRVEGASPHMVWARLRRSVLPSAAKPRNRERDMKRTLVIGSTGLLGSHLVKALQGKAEVVEASFGRAPHKVDIADPASLRRLFEAVGPVDAIACTAGMARFVPWAQATDGDWAHGVANKLMGQVNVVRLGAPFVRDGGAITLTTGVLAQYPMPGGAIFTTANAAVEGFVRAAALEFGSRIRVNVVSPGWITETLTALGMDPTPGVPAEEAALAYVQAMENGASGSVLPVSRRG